MVLVVGPLQREIYSGLIAIIIVEKQKQKTFRLFNNSLSRGKEADINTNGKYNYFYGRLLQTNKSVNTIHTKFTL